MFTNLAIINQNQIPWNPLVKNHHVSMVFPTPSGQETQLQHKQIAVGRRVSLIIPLMSRRVKSTCLADHVVPPKFVCIANKGLL